MSRAGIAAAALLFVTGCGFQPLYGPQQIGADGVSPLQQIAVSPIPERVGQLLRIELTKNLNPKGPPATPVYRLGVTVRESKQNLAVRKDATATRANLIIVATYTLSDAQSRQTLLKGSVRSINSYNILDADFATLSAEADARRRAARDLATEIQSRVGLFLARPTGS